MQESNETTPLDAIPLACNLSPSAQAERGTQVAALFRHIEQVEELADGYAFRFPAVERWAAQLLTFILEERVCCPFFRFELVFEPDAGPLWLHLRGGEEVKEFIQQEWPSGETVLPTA